MALSNLNALSVAMHAEQDVAVRALKLQLEEKQLALERARMSTEDARAAMASPYRYYWGCEGRPLSWREIGVKGNEKCNHLNEHVIEPARKLVVDAQSEMAWALEFPNFNHKVALTDAYNAICAVEECLKDNSDNESDSDLTGL